jgi:hypothetical protein
MVYWLHGTSWHCHFGRFQGIQQNSISKMISGSGWFEKLLQEWIEKYFGQIKKAKKLKNKISLKNQQRTLKTTYQDQIFRFYVGGII